MPELPEVETIRRQLESTIVNSIILDAAANPIAKFEDAVQAIGNEILDISRRGKFLIINLDDQRELIIHLGMTGKLTTSKEKEVSKHTHAWWELIKDNKKFFLLYNDVRKFGKISIAENKDYRKLPTLNSIGPEPLSEELTKEIFWTNLNRSHRKIKTQLLSQKPVAGIGNIYADESLWLSKINPHKRSLTKSESENLLFAIRQIITKAVQNGGTTLKDYRDSNNNKGTNQYSLNVYGRKNQECFRCGHELFTEVIDSRTTTWCKNCQK